MGAQRIFLPEQMATLAETARITVDQANYDRFCETYDRFCEECQSAAIALTSPDQARSYYANIVALKSQALSFSHTLGKLLEIDDLGTLLGGTYGDHARLANLQREVRALSSAASRSIEKNRVRKLGRGRPSRDASLDLFFFHMTSAWKLATGKQPGTSSGGKQTTRGGPFVRFLNQGLGFLEMRRGAIGSSYAHGAATIGSRSGNIIRVYERILFYPAVLNSSWYSLMRSHSFV